MKKPVELKRSSSRKFGEDEDHLIIKLHALLGNRWALIAGRLPGRREKEVKKYWNKHMKQKLLRMGIDPDNHRLACFVLHPPTSTHTSRGIDNTQTQTKGAPAAAADTIATPLPDLNLDITIAPPIRTDQPNNY